MSKQFQVGDVVQLKSGGPSMTIQNIDHYEYDTPSALCVWFDGRERREALFVIESLTSYEPGAGIAIG